MRTPVRGSSPPRPARSFIPWSLLALLATTALLSAGHGRARAADRWTTPHPGVRHLYRTASGPRRIHALSIDLCRAGISLRATRSDERRRTVPSFATLAGAQAAINGDFFSFATYAPSGVAVGRSSRWGGGDSRYNAFLALGRDRAWVEPGREAVDPIPAWVEQLVSGHPGILVDGELPSLTNDLCTARHPRTMAGLSRDRHTLFLAVVDGRSSSSIGMTCAEGGRLMRDLGAWDALNLDGGGSSTMWIAGSGVVNHPSDGTPRVVSNHLAVFARGSGVPRSCQPWEPDEVSIMAGSLEGGSTTDLDGDGRADVCARAAGGIRCHLSSDEAFDTIIEGPALADATGWGDPTNYETLVLGDVTGDGLADLCARAGAGVRCWPSTGSGFGERIVGPELSDAAGWARARYYATLRLADVDGDGADDICARGAAGFICWRSTGDGFEDGWAPLEALSDAAGFDGPSAYGTLRMGDVNGDGLSDVCARGSEGMRCWLSMGVAFDPEPIAGPRWTDASGWGAHPHYSTIRLADVDGDLRADLCARGAHDFRCQLSDGAGFGAPIKIDALSNAEGWGELPRYATLRLADIDGDRDLDLCARGADGIRCWPFEGAAWGAPLEGPALTDARGWGRAIYYRTLRFGDIDGDGDEDLCARAAAGFQCWPAEPGGFGARVTGPEWSNDSGWWPLRHHSTLRLAGPRRAPPLLPPPALAPGEDAGAPGGDWDPDAPDAGLPAATPSSGAGERGATMTGGCAVPGRPSGGAPLLALLGLLLLVVPRARRRARPVEPPGH